MASKHIKLEILLLSIIIFILLTDYTLLLGHPSTRVGLITKNLAEKLRQRQARRAVGRNSSRIRRLDATPYLRHDSSNKPSSSVEVRLSSVTLEFVPRAWLVNTVRKMMIYTGSHDQTDESR